MSNTTLFERDMSDFIRSYIATALWSSMDDNDEPLEDNYGKEDFSSEVLMNMYFDCYAFVRENRTNINRPYSEAGHDFWLTRNGHGAGFWDGDWADKGDVLTKGAEKFKGVDLYVGDDGRIYSWHLRYHSL